MAQDGTKLQMVERHVRQGTAQMQQQCEIVAHLKATERPTEMAETLLRQFERLQQQHETHLARIKNRPHGETDNLIALKPP